MANALFSSLGLAWNLSHPNLDESYLGTDYELLQTNPTRVRENIEKFLDQPSPLVPDSQGNITLEIKGFEFIYPYQELTTVRDVISAIAAIMQTDLVESNEPDITYEQLGEWSYDQYPGHPVKFYDLLGDNLYFEALSSFGRPRGHYEIGTGS